jgi:tetratricopeptide (TPR) repeat protein
MSEIVNTCCAPQEEYLLELEKSIMQYPYCQTTWMLLASGWAVYDHLKLQQNLPKIATIVSNRVQLKQIINYSVNQIPFADITTQPNSAIADFQPTNVSQNQDAIQELLDIQNCLQSLMNELDEIDENISTIIDDSQELYVSKKEDPIKISSYDISKGYAVPFSEKETKKDEKKEAEALLIDRFLEIKPTISRTTGDFFNPENMIEQSIDYLQHPVSETLAIILARQGHVDEAIKIYNKLILENPKKSSYFATQINKLSNTNI